MSLGLDDFLSLRQQLPSLDVRSEGEYAQGHIRFVHNLPLLNDRERAEVGTVYKQQGQQAAVLTGFRLVGPRLHQLVEQAVERAQGRELLIHCWRGGMRSAHFSRFVQMAGIKTRTLEGGYKVYRQRAVESFAKPWKLILLGGSTGSGKTEILRALALEGEQVVDLEHLASHRGSAFGALGLPPQPTTEQFQNDLFETLYSFDPQKRIWVEDESIAIGTIFLPVPFWQTMGQAPVIVADVPKYQRLARLVQMYGYQHAVEFSAAIQKITRKLGGQHAQAALACVHAHDWVGAIDILLTYYDKAYQRALARKESQVVARIPSAPDALSMARHLQEVADSLFVP